MKRRRWRARWIGLLALQLGSVTAGNAHAVESSAADGAAADGTAADGTAADGTAAAADGFESPHQRDAKLPVGVGMAIGGALSLGGGIAAYIAGSDGRQACPLLGGACVTIPDTKLQTAGVLMMGGGIASGLFGGVMIHGGSAKVPYPADSQGLMGTGAALTGLGAAGVVGASAAWMFAAFEDEDALPIAGTALGISGTLLTVGLPLWFAGSKPPADHQRFADVQVPEEDWVHRNPAMATAGVGMMVVGTGVIAAGIGTGVELLGNEGDLKNEGGLFSMGTMIVAGGTLLTMGVIMTVKGARKVPPHEAYASRDDELQRAVPEVRIGPMSGELRWTF
jgi:hypothetical protein